ncbi:MAG TPA: Stp1/IreP family PP2C-type Ser/Thr phosphatase [Acidimicrobiales bacterium]|nr:Stp1/IreP family PP2C-type Ser/Thr phosphatase [Acidimicrobiales bacterium]
MTRLHAGSATDVGRVRPINQDRFLVADHLYAVADGMGGHAAGDVAATIAVDTLAAEFGRHPDGDGLLSAIKEANRTVWERSRNDPELRGMGTTLTALALVSQDGHEQLMLTNVGDSRAYLFKDGELTQLTADHTLVEEMVRAGELSEAEAVGHPHRHVLTRALGIEPELSVDSWLLDPAGGDRILLCSDGLINEVRDGDIASVLREVADPEEAAARLVALAHEHGGTDNITAVVVDIDGDSGGATEQSAAGATATPAGATAAPAAAAATPAPAPASPAPASPAPAESHEPAAPPPPPPPPPPPGRSARAARGGRSRAGGRRVTVRLVAFVLALAVVIAGAAAAIVWYARAGYYVGLRGDRLTIFQGRPGGLLWFNPTIADRTPYTSQQVLAYHLADLKQGRTESSLTAARRYVRNLVDEANAARAAAAPPQPAPGAPTPATQPGAPATTQRGAPSSTTSTTAR